VCTLTDALTKNFSTLKHLFVIKINFAIEFHK
jgi:hypothetical protein